MLKGLFYPYTPTGASSIIPDLPWSYAGNIFAVEYRADMDKAAALLPEGFRAVSDKCSVFFCDWQASAASGAGYLDPVRSQYLEAFFLIECEYRGETKAYCPFIWVDNDTALLRGLLQGFPKQLGDIGMTRVMPVPSAASPVYGPGNAFAGTCAAKNRELFSVKVTAREKADHLPDPNFGQVINRLTIPDLRAGRIGDTLFKMIVKKTNSTDVHVSDIWQGDAEFRLNTDYYPDLGLMAPVKVGKGYVFSFAFTVQSLEYDL